MISVVVVPKWTMISFQKNQIDWWQQYVQNIFSYRLVFKNKQIVKFYLKIMVILETSSVGMISSNSLFKI